MTRDETRQSGATLNGKLGLGPTTDRESVPGLAAFLDEVAHAGIWRRPGLPLADRMLCTLAVLALHQRLPQLERMVGAALDLGLAPRAILEVFMQAGLYGGYPTTETAGDCAQMVFRSRGITVPPDPPRAESHDELDRRGRALMAELHAERAQGGYAAPGNPITGALYPSAIRFGYGELWFRPGLDHRQRMLVALASFTALSLDGLLEKFSRSALNVGLKREEIIEAVIQTGPYSGFPRALNGLSILTRSLA